MILKEIVYHATNLVDIINAGPNIIYPTDEEKKTVDEQLQELVNHPTYEDWLATLDTK